MGSPKQMCRGKGQKRRAKWREGEKKMEGGRKKKGRTGQIGQEKKRWRGRDKGRKER